MSGPAHEEVLREKRVRPPVHPGRVLELEFLKPLEMTAYQLAKAIGVMPPRIYEIVHGERAVSADTALRLGRYFGTGPEFWLNLHSHHDLELARERFIGPPYNTGNENWVYSRNQEIFANDLRAEFCYTTFL